MALPWCFCHHAGYPAALAETPQQQTPLSCDHHTLQTLTSSSPLGLIRLSCPVLELPCLAGYNLLLKCHIIHHSVALPSSCKCSRRIALSHHPPYTSTPMERLLTPEAAHFMPTFSKTGLVEINQPRPVYPAQFSCPIIA